MQRVTIRVILIVICFYMSALTGYAGEVYPERIISLVPSVTEELYLLNVEDRLIANTVYCNRPEEAKRKEKVGTVIEINLEKIIQLEPDLILSSSLTDSRAREKLKSLGMKVVTFPQASSLSELSRQFLELARLLGKEKEAQQIVAVVERRVSSVRERVNGLPKPKVFVQIGANPLFTANKSSFINDFIELAGGTNVARDAKTGIYSREEVLRHNPDVILIATMGIGEEEKKNWQNYATLNAVRNDRIYVVDSYRFCSPTPVTFVEILQETAKILHPESPPPISFPVEEED